MNSHEFTVGILCVDDEINILKSLQRVLKKLPLTLHFASTGPQALAVLKKHPIDIVITDMRMPEMSGDELLEKVNQTWPDVKKVLLSGFTEKEGLVKALNKGGVDFFIEKPWDNKALLLQINSMVKELAREYAKKASRSKLVAAYKKTLNKDNNNVNSKRNADSVNLLKRMIKEHSALDEVYAARVSQYAAEFAITMGLSEPQAEMLGKAGYLSEIGKLGISNAALKPFKTLSAALQSEYKKQNDCIESILRSTPSLSVVKDTLVQQFKPLSSEFMTKEGLLLTVVADYWRMRMGKWQAIPMTDSEAKRELHQFKGIRYDSDTVERFIEWLDGKKVFQELNTISMDSLSPGMVLLTNLTNIAGSTLLPKGHVLTRACIARLNKVSCINMNSLKVKSASSAE